MKTIRLCPGCGAPLTSDAPGGLCPQCLLQTQVIGEDEFAAASRPRTVPIVDGQFGGYRIVRLLGHGGMGIVYEAEHAVTGRRVALKVMRHTLASEQDRKRFLREGRLAASISHPNVVYIHGSEEIDGAPAIAMELVHGGTLKDRLKREGPLPISDAAAAALQIIDGLEAAHVAGILHRDIKPANCFVAADGTVKVGDFGLSVSTLARGESLITATGSVMGTPAYASPEQLRGEELDVTSDIYSVGATLYHLLTGKTPFNATDFVKLITEVLDKQPASPKSLRAEIPGELSKILLRCLAKDRKARFQTYTELRDALLPFRAAEAVPARPAMRVLAALIDETIAFGPSWIFLIYWSLDPLDKLAHERTWHAAAIWFPFFVWYLSYYAINEGLWGAGLGKSICGLRVVGMNRQPPGVLRALFRTLTSSLPITLPPFLLMLTVPLTKLSVASEPSEWLTGREGSVITDWAWLPLTILLFITMRRRNGYAAVHDLVTRTRVIVRPRTQPRPVLAQVVPPTPNSTAAALPGLGPYQPNGVPWRNSGEELVLAFDPALQRKIWIHLRPLDAAPVSEARRDVSRAARLRWINHGQTETARWDAYEALEGAPFLAVVQRAHPWNAVRFWLLDLAEEFSATLECPDTAPRLGLSHLWITNSGRAVLLDFPAAASPSPATSTFLDGLETAQKFLDSDARYALQGAAESSTANAGEPIHALVPTHARSFLTSLARGTFDHARFVIGNLQSLVSKPAEVSRPRRAASLAFVPLLILMLGGSLAGIVSFDRIRWDRAWTAAYPELPSMRSAAELYAHRAEAAKEGEESKALELIGAYITTHHSQLITNKHFWASPLGKMMEGTSEQEMLQQALAQHPEPSALRRAEAEQRIPKRLARHDRDRRFLGFKIAAGMALFIPAVVALVELLGALAFGVSPVLRLFGIAVVTRNGSEASRWHLVLRVLVLWAPVVGGAVLVLGLGAYLMEADAGWVRHFWVAVLMTSTVVLLGVMAFAGIRPAAGLQDLVARTRLVPV
ncbi:MAG TPA: protein kinase [Methylomirabilota bacterium]|nr:protein kinase [Methylomirabilota bacterium]